MRQKLALIIALAGFAVVTALGVGMAGAEQEPGLTGNDAAGATGSLPEEAGSLPQEVATLPACANQADDDGDALTDLDDPDCVDAADESEEPEAEAEAPPAPPAGAAGPAAGEQPALSAERLVRHAHVGLQQREDRLVRRAATV